MDKYLKKKTLTPEQEEALENRLSKAEADEARELAREVEAKRAARGLGQPNRMTRVVDDIEAKYVGAGATRVLERHEMPDADDADGDADDDDEPYMSVNGTDVSDDDDFDEDDSDEDDDEDEDEDEEEDEEGDDDSGLDEGDAGSEGARQEARVRDVTTRVREGRYQPRQLPVRPGTAVKLDKALDDDDLDAMDEDAMDADVDEDIDYDDEDNVVTKEEVEFERMAQFELVKWCFAGHREIFDTPHTGANKKLVDGWREDGEIAQKFFQDATRWYLWALSRIGRETHAAGKETNMCALMKLVQRSAHMTSAKLPPSKWVPGDPEGPQPVQTRCSIMDVPIKGYAPASGGVDPQQGYSVRFLIEQPKPKRVLPLEQPPQENDSSYLEFTFILCQQALRLVGAFSYIINIRAIINADMATRLAAYYNEKPGKSGFFYYQAYQRDPRQWAKYFYYHFKRAKDIITDELMLAAVSEVVPGL